LKAETIAGLSDETIAMLNGKYGDTVDGRKKWMTTGEYAVVQLCAP